MKPCLKYPLTIIVLLLIGYTQLFAQLNRGFASTDLGKSRTVFSQDGSLVPSIEADIIFQETAIEEDDDRVSAVMPVCSFSYPEIMSTHGLSSRGSAYKHFVLRHSSTEPWILFRVFRL